MLNKVWRWAGQYRKAKRNLGDAPHLIQPNLIQLIRDAEFWVENKTYSADELAVRFHHRAVLVHPFANGNGRWARLAADLLVTNLGGTRFTWGGGNLQVVGESRKAYIDALHAADSHDLGPLIKFARS